MGERSTRERSPAKQQPADDASARVRSEPTEDVVPRWSGGPDQWAGALRDRPSDDQRALAGALGSRAGNAALQRFISTTISGRSSGRPRPKPKPGAAPRGPGKAGTATFRFAKQGAVETPIEEFSFGAMAPHDLATGQASAKAAFEDISFVRQSDDLSPMFMQAETTNEAIEIELRLTAPGAQGGAVEAFVYRFTGAQLSSFTQSGGAGSPTESLRARFAGWSLQTPDEGEAPTAGGEAGTMHVPELSDEDIALHGLSWGASAPTDAATGQRAGRVRRQAVTITKDMDASSPKLLGQLSTHAVIPKATFVLSGGGGQMELQDVEVASVKHSAVGGKPVETVDLLFGEMESSANDAVDVPDAPASLEVDAVRQGAFSSPVLAWRAGMHTSTDPASGQVTGKRRHQAFEMTVPGGPATVRFINALDANENFKAARLTPKTGPAFGLGNASVVALEMGTDDKQQPTTTVKLVYQGIEEAAEGVVAQDTWSNDPEGGGGTGNASAKESGAAPPGPGKAGTATVTFAKQGTFETPIEAFSFGGASPHDPATGQTSAKMRYQDLVLVRQSDRLSPTFFNAESTNEALSLEVRLLAPQADGSSSETFTYRFTQASLSSFVQSGGAGSPTETINLRFGGWSLETPGGDQTPAPGGEAGAMTAKELSEDDIPLHAVSWGATRPTDRATGQATGRMVQKQVSITKDMDASSPKVLAALQTNSVLPDATLALGAGGTMSLKNVSVGSVTQSAGAERPVETVTLLFEDLDYSVEQSGGEVKDAPGFLQAEGTRTGPWSSPALRWGWGMSSPGRNDGGGATGRRRLREFEITLPAGGPSAAHALSALDTNEVLKKAELVPKSGPAFTLENARVSDVQLAADDEQQPTASIKLVYQTIEQQAGDRMAVDNWSDNT